jgi:hypothetical protein
VNGPRRLIEQSPLVARLVDDANKREPSAEVMQKVLAILDSPAAAPSAPVRATARLRGLQPWISLALVGVGALVVLGYSTLRHPAEPAPTVDAPARVPVDEPSVGAPIQERAPDPVPLLSISDLPDSKSGSGSSSERAEGDRARRHRNGATAGAVKASTARELEHITRAREALTKGDTRACLAAIRQHDAEFPEGQYGPEAAVMRIEATYASGDRAQASALARALLAKSPESPYAARIRSLLTSAEKE